MNSLSRPLTFLSALVLFLSSAGSLSAQQTLVAPRGDHVSTISCSGETPITCPAVPAGEWQITLDSPAKESQLTLADSKGSSLPKPTSAILRGLQGPVHVYRFTLGNTTDIVITPVSTGESPFYVMLGRSVPSADAPAAVAAAPAAAPQRTGVVVSVNPAAPHSDESPASLFMLYGCTCILPAAGVLGLFLLLRKRRKRAASPAAGSTHPALSPDTEAAPVLLRIEVPDAPLCVLGLYPKKLSTPIFIGRKSGCHITLKHRTVSAKHCSLRIEEKHLALRDENSTNGTRLNGARMAPRQSVSLHHADSITLGAVTITIIRQH